nr:MAG TPA: hypothetical protein [Caudoviricetes sp.]
MRAHQGPLAVARAGYPEGPVLLSARPRGHGAGGGLPRQRAESAHRRDP